MRDDMANVIVERPRIPGHNVRKGRALPFDQLPAQQGMRRPYVRFRNSKKLDENLAPLRRYLARQVGRPWDKVYSEIAAHLRVDSAVQQHVRDHLDDYVAIKPRRIQRRQSERSGLWRQPFYVDPATGLLKRTDRLAEVKAVRWARQRTKPAAPERIALAADRELRRLDGIWYSVQLAPLPEPVYRVVPGNQVQDDPFFHDPFFHDPIFDDPFFGVPTTWRRLVTPAVWDVATRALIPAGPEIDTPYSCCVYRLDYPDRRYAVSKRVLSKAELRRHGLHNLPPSED